MQEQQRYQQARLVTVVGAGSNIVQAILKLIIGTLGHSHAMVADGIHSLSDLLVDGLVLFASKVGSRHADIDHPYGHRRIETAATTGLALLLILAGIGIMYDAGGHLWSGQHVQPHSYVLWIALLSILANEALFHYTLLIGKQVKSQLVIANAWHHRSDALASLVVLIGVGGAVLGWVYLDAIAAIIVGIMVIKIGWDLGWSSICELVDTGVDDATLAQIHETIAAVPGVEAVHQLRNRAMGGNIFIDVHILVKPHLSVSEGHYIAAKVHNNLVNQFEKITDVTVHVDPEPDEMYSPSATLPARNEILPLLHTAWKNLEAYNQIESITLHYLSDKIEVEVRFPWSVASQIKDVNVLSQQYMQAIKHLDVIRSVVILFTI